MSARLVAALCLFPALAGVQAGTRIAEGRLLKPLSPADAQGVPGQWVVLHRVGSDQAGPLDSVRSGPGGRFRFRYRATGSPEALYFVSAMYGGIAYFSPPLRSAVVRGGDADVIVYETTRDTSSLRVQGRHLVVSQARGPRREIAEIFELENQSTRTVVAADSAPLWSTTLPEVAESASVAPGDVAAGAVRFSRGRAALFAPLSPGVRQLVITYLVPNDAFPISFPMQRPTSVLEVLLEDPRGSVKGVDVREVDAANIEGRTFRRLLAQDVEANRVVSVDMPAPPGQNSRVLAVVIGTVGAVMIVGLVVWLGKRGRRRIAEVPVPRAAATTAEPSDVERLVADLAALDAAHERSAPHDAAVDAAYRQRRADLKARLERALAAETVRR